LLVPGGKYTYKVLKRGRLKNSNFLHQTNTIQSDL